MKKLKVALLGLVLIAASVIGIAAVAQPAGAIVCSPGAYLGAYELGWHAGTQSSVHAAEDLWCNANGDDYGAEHYNFDLYPHAYPGTHFSNFDTWMSWNNSWVSVFGDHIIRVDGFHSHSVALDINERTWDYTWMFQSNYDFVTYGSPSSQNGSVQFGCMPHGRCYGWDWYNWNNNGWWEFAIEY